MSVPATSNLKRRSSARNTRRCFQRLVRPIDRLIRRCKWHHARYKKLEAAFLQEGNGRIIGPSSTENGDNCQVEMVKTAMLMWEIKDRSPKQYRRLERQFRLSA
jgi:hypothetical protein